MLINTNTQCHIYFAYAHLSQFITRQTFDYAIYISTISIHVNYSNTFHFNTRVGWLEIRYWYFIIHNTNNTTNSHNGDENKIVETED